jgi:acetyl/propionyl-CoA carboxylase alpha subunit
MVCAGTVTNQTLLSQILKHPDFRRGAYNTHFIADHIDIALQAADTAGLAQAMIASTLYRWGIRDQKRALLRAMPSGWRNSFNDYQIDTFRAGEQELSVRYRYAKGAFEIIAPDGEQKNVSIVNVQDESITVEIDGHVKTYHVVDTDDIIYLHHGSVGNVALEKVDRLPIKEIEKVAGGYEAPMPAQVIDVLVASGDKVSEGDGLVIISSMKMESTVEAESDGIVEEVYVNPGQAIEAGHIMLKLALKEE